MYALLLTWDLSKSDLTIFEELRRHIIEEAWARYRTAPGLIEKIWFSQEDHAVFGAFYLWENEQALEGELATIHSVEQRTGVKPRVQRFDVEAVQEGKPTVRNRVAYGKAWALANLHDS